MPPISRFIQQRPGRAAVTHAGSDVWQHLADTHQLKVLNTNALAKPASNHVPLRLLRVLMREIICPQAGCA